MENHIRKNRQLIKRLQIKKGLRFYWKWVPFRESFCGVYEVICFKNLFEIFCYKRIGLRATIKTDGKLAKFDQRINNNPKLGFKIIPILVCK